MLRVISEFILLFLVSSVGKKKTSVTNFNDLHPFYTKIRINLVDMTEHVCLHYPKSPCTYKFNGTSKWKNKICFHTHTQILCLLNSHLISTHMEKDNSVLSIHIAHQQGR